MLSVIFTIGFGFIVLFTVAMAVSYSLGSVAARVGPWILRYTNPICWGSGLAAMILFYYLNFS